MIPKRPLDLFVEIMDGIFTTFNVFAYMKKAL